MYREHKFKNISFEVPVKRKSDKGSKKGSERTNIDDRVTCFANRYEDDGWCHRYSVETNEIDEHVETIADRRVPVHYFLL